MPYERFRAKRQPDTRTNHGLSRQSEGGEEVRERNAAEMTRRHERAVRLLGAAVQTQRERCPLGSPRQRQSTAARIARVLGACNSIESSGCQINTVVAERDGASAVDALRTVHADMSLESGPDRMTVEHGLRVARSACKALIGYLRQPIAGTITAISGGAPCNGGSCDRTPRASYVGTGVWLPLGATGSLVRPYPAGSRRIVCAAHEEELAPLIAAGVLRREDETGAIRQNERTS